MSSNAHQTIRGVIQPTSENLPVKPKGVGRHGAFVESDANPTESDIVETPIKLDLVFREALRTAIPNFNNAKLRVDLDYPDGVKTEDAQLWHAIATYSGGGIFSSEIRLLAFVVETPGEVNEVIERFRQTEKELRDVKALYIIAREAISNAATTICNDVKGILDVSVHKY